MIPVDQGEVHVGPHAVHRLRANKEMIALRKDVSIAFQQYDLFPQKTALAMRPALLLFDEVTAALDPETRNKVLITIRQRVEDGPPAALFGSPQKERASAFLERVL